MIAKNLARWRAEAKRKGKTPNLPYLIARDRQATQPGIVWTTESRVKPRWRSQAEIDRILFNPEWLTAFPAFGEAMAGMAEAAKQASKALTGLSVTGQFTPATVNQVYDVDLDGFYVPRSAD